MPNWCNNELTISHPDKAMIDRAINAWNSGKFLDEFIPVPFDLKETIKGFLGGNDQKELEEKQKRNVEQYGHATWWDFCVSEWGTKWDIGRSQDYDNEPTILTDNSFHVYFDSAWSPPVNAYYKLEEMGFKIEAYYFEGGICFWGEFKDGEDHEFSAESYDRIPTDIREMFGIEPPEDEEENEEVKEIQE